MGIEELRTHNEKKNGQREVCTNKVIYMYVKAVTKENNNRQQYSTR